MASPVSRTACDRRTQPGTARVLPRKIHQAPTARDGGSRWRAAVNPAAGAFQRVRPRHETQDARREGRREGWGRRKSDSDSPRWELSSSISTRKTGDPRHPLPPHSPPPLPAFTLHFLSPRKRERVRERGKKDSVFLGLPVCPLNRGDWGRKSGRFHLSNLTSDWALKEKGAVCSHGVCKLRHEDKKNKKTGNPVSA